MNAHPRILSTKKLTPAQRERLLNAGFALVEIPMVSTRPVPFDVPMHIPKAIITSKNAVAAISGKGIRIDQCFCVGSKTAAALEAAGYAPEVVADTGAALALILTERFPGACFTYLGTRSRRDELPKVLKAHNTPLTEIEVYETVIEAREVPGTFDGILFFSPSAVQAFSQKNSFSGAVCFSIGPTTGSTLKEHHAEVITARQSTAEHLILETITYFKSINANNRETSI